MLAGLQAMFRTSGVTSLLTLETESLYTLESVTDRGLSPIADNLIALRYDHSPGELRPCITIVKTRGSQHDRGIYYFSVAPGGVRIGDRVGEGRR